MSKTVTFNCNLCGEAKERSQILSLYYDSTIKVPPPVNFGKYRLATNPDHSDKHICTECIEVIKTDTTPPHNN